MKQNIDICLSSHLIDLFDINESTVVVIDVLRATTAICEAFKNGVKTIIPVSDINEAQAFKKKGYIVAAERDGKVLDFADFGNSPHNFSMERVKDKTIVYSTVNGVPALQKVENAKQIFVASFLNLNAIVDFLSKSNRDILLLCAGWKGNFNLEDTLLAGAIVEKLNKNSKINPANDAVIAAVDLWRIYGENLQERAEEFFQIKRLKNLRITDKLSDYFTLNSCDYIPIYENGVILNLNSKI